MDKMNAIKNINLFNLPLMHWACHFPKNM